MNLEKIIKDKPRTAPGSAQPSEVTALKVFEILDLYSLSINKTNKRKMTIKKLEINDQMLLKEKNLVEDIFGKVWDFL